MYYVELPDNDTVIRPLPFYLAMEEYVARNRTEDEMWFMWVVDPTVIIGRNQLLDNEVDMAYCQQHGIAVYRRKSGGGCVYADRSNVMFSYICSSDDVIPVFKSYTDRIVRMLAGIGISAEAGGRNDVMIGGRKVSGNAFYHIPGRSIAHGTMLYDTDIENMTGAINPPATKLRSNGVGSVRQRITTLRDNGISMTLSEFMDVARKSMSDGVITLTDRDINEIWRIAESYMRPEWIYGHNPAATFSQSRYIDGVGGFQVDMEVKGSTIRSVNISGDFFLTGELDSLLTKLTGVGYNRSDIIDALICTDVGEIISGLDTDSFVDLLFADKTNLRP